MNAALIPVYNADGSLYAWASEQRFARLQLAGLVARVVCHRKGRINRAILFIRPGEPKPMSATEFAAFMADETKKWAEVVEKAGIKAQ